MARQTKSKKKKKKKVDSYCGGHFDEKAWLAIPIEERNKMIDLFDNGENEAYEKAISDHIDSEILSKQTTTVSDKEKHLLETIQLTPIITPEEEAVIKKFFDRHPELKADKESVGDSIKAATGGGAFTLGAYKYNPKDAWIQTYSGRRFTPTNPYPDAIVIQDISHALSMQCRFSGHVKKFYSVAQHCVLVSYICDSADALWGLMHDATEAYLVDVPRPLKRSGKFDAYLEFEHKMQLAICERFGLPNQEPASVKRADTILLATEARDLMAPLHPDWVQPCDPLPFKIDPLPPQEAKDLFMKRFYELTGHTGGYEHYLKYNRT